MIQVDNEGAKHAVSYFSRATTEMESKYHSYELEALAVVETLQRFKYYLLNKHFVVFTDCNSLKLSHSKRDLIPRIARWWLKIQEFSFDIEYREGKRMAHVDALSRSPHEEANESDTVAEKIMTIAVDEEDWLAALQSQDN